MSALFESQLLKFYFILFFTLTFSVSLYHRRKYAITSTMRQVYYFIAIYTHQGVFAFMCKLVYACNCLCVLFHSASCKLYDHKLPIIRMDITFDKCKHLDMPILWLFQFPTLTTYHTMIINEFFLQMIASESVPHWLPPVVTLHRVVFVCFCIFLVNEYHSFCRGLCILTFSFVDE